MVILFLVLVKNPVGCVLLKAMITTCVYVVSWIALSSSKACCLPWNEYYVNNNFLWRMIQITLWGRRGMSHWNSSMEGFSMQGKPKVDQRVNCWDQIKMVKNYRTVFMPTAVLTSKQSSCVQYACWVLSSWLAGRSYRQPRHCCKVTWIEALGGLLIEHSSSGAPLSQRMLLRPRPLTEWKKALSHFKRISILIKMKIYCETRASYNKETFSNYCSRVHNMLLFLKTGVFRICSIYPWRFHWISPIRHWLRLAVNIYSSNAVQHSLTTHLCKWGFNIKEKRFLLLVLEAWWPASNIPDSVSWTFAETCLLKTCFSARSSFAAIICKMHFGRWFQDPDEQ